MSGSIFSKQEISILNTLDNSRLRLHIMPTEKCNFRCKYCYEDFLKGKMKPHIVKKIKAYLHLRLPELKQITLSWFGGEPLLAYDVIKDIQKFVLENKNTNTLFESDVTTNGYLLSNAMFLQLSTLGVKMYSISLDGIGSIHNNTRTHIKASIDTFSKIWDNLLQIKSSSVSCRIMVRIHHHPNNMHNILELVNLLNETLFIDPRFFPFIEPISDFCGGYDVPYYTTKKHADENTAIIRTMLNSTERFNFDDYICYAASPNNLIIRQDGTLAKCTVALNSDLNHIGHINEDGTLHLDSDKIALWSQGLRKGDNKFNACPNGGLSAMKSSEKRSAHILRYTKKSDRIVTGA